MYACIYVYIFIYNVCITRLCMSNYKLFTLLDLCVSSLHRGHANLLCIVPILTDDPRRESGAQCRSHHITAIGKHNVPYHIYIYIYI